MQKLSCLTISIVLICSGLAAAGDADTEITEESILTLETEWQTPFGILAEMEVEYELWLEAMVAGQDRETARLEKNLLGLVSHDILLEQDRVRNMARSRALVSSDDKSTDHDTDAVDRHKFQLAIGYLNTKEALYRSLTRTEAFSNRYRLLGDYIDLLRRELKMPRLKLARSEKPSAPETRTDIK